MTLFLAGLLLVVVIQSFNSASANLTYVPPPHVPNKDPPTLTAQSPLNNSVYPAGDVLLNFSVSIPDSYPVWPPYLILGNVTSELDGQVTLLWNGASSYSFPLEIEVPLKGLAWGGHALTLTAYADSVYTLDPTSTNSHGGSYHILNYPVNNSEVIRFCVGKESEAPQIQWTKTYSTGTSSAIRSMTPTSDGGYALSGLFMNLQLGQGGCWLLKTDGSGNEQWSQTYSGLGNGYSVIQTSDGGYALIGSGCLVKTNSLGVMQWNRTYGGQTIALVQTNDEGYAVAGYNMEYAGHMAFWLYKTDSEGYMQWNQTYGTLKSGTAWALIQSQDGGYVLGGEGSIVKTDSRGNLVWNLTVSGTVYSVIQAEDGAFIVAGNTATPSGGNNDLWLAKIESSGAMLWNQTYNMIDESRKGWWGAWSVIQTADGGYAVAGSLSLVKTDSLGNAQWSLPLNGTAYSVVQASDGSYMLAGGDAGIFFAGSWLMKTFPTEADAASIHKNTTSPMVATPSTTPSKSSPSTSLIQNIQPSSMPSDSPEVPEFSHVAVLALMAAIVFVVAVVTQRKMHLKKPTSKNNSAPR